MVARSLGLSQEQSQAVRSFGSDIGLSASAGSGKTTVLVEKYLEALNKHHCTPQNILAVTFTDKAAGSMKQRLVRRCEELGSYAIARELEGAWIGTLHSFCARVLRENPVECGVDPRFKILSQGEQDLWMSDILEVIFRETAGDPSIQKLLVDYGEDAVMVGINKLYDLDRAHARDARLLDVSLFDAERSSLERHMIDLASELGSIFAQQSKLSPSQTEQRAATAGIVKIFERIKAPSWDRWNEIKLCMDTLDERSPKTKAVVAKLRDGYGQWARLEIQALSADIKGSFIRLFEIFRMRYEMQKREKGLYDFEDLLFLTYQALAGTSEANKALRKRYQDQFEAIFVDEYQDTSHLQAKILDLIKRPANLFVVGDVYQSIYGFRHASPELFERAMQNSQRLELRENYRSRQEVLDFVNGLFGQIFSGKFTPMIAKRGQPLRTEPCVEWLCVPKEQELTLDACRVWEARSLAHRIRGMVDSGFIIEDEKGRRPLRYKDIAILFRKTTASRVFEKELEACSIPYFVQKGRGFFDRPEIKDLVQILRVLNYGHEDIPLAGVLRSPLVQLSDDGLFWVAKARLSSDDSLHDALMRWESIAELSEQDRVKLNRFIELLSVLKESKERLTLSQLLREVLRCTAYEAKILSRPDGDLAQGNVQKLLEMAESFEEKGVSDLNGFTRFIHRMNESEESEPEARLVGEEEDVVRLLTVHAAKGLEFPCVILADLGSELSSKSHTSLDADPMTGLGLKLRVPDTFHYEADHSLALLKKVRDEREREEQSRLLYVAMTRAKDHLILSGVLARSSWSDLLSKILGLGAMETALTAMYGKIPIQIVPLIKQRKFAPTKEKKRLIDQLGSASVDGEEMSIMKQRLVVPQKPYQMLEDITVSDVLSVVSHEEIEILPQPASDDEDELPRNEYGTLYHKIMECSVRSSKRGTVTPALLDRLMRDLSEAQRSEMQKSYTNFWSTPTAGDIMRSPRVYTEIPFIYKTPHGLLKGQIDLLFQSSDGEWVILDYKTNRIRPEQLSDTAKRYEWQLGLYALIFRQLYGKMPTKGLLYFSSVNLFSETIYTPQALDKLSQELLEIYPKVAFA